MSRRQNPFGIWNQLRRPKFEMLESRLMLNSDPVINIPYEADEDVLTTICQIQVGDVDAGDNELLMELSVDHGQFSLLQTDGLTFRTGDGTLDRSMSFTGTLDALNAAMLFIDYLGDPNFNGTDIFHLYVNDQGFTGDGGALDARADLDITVHAVNDIPVVQLPLEQFVSEDACSYLDSIVISDDAVETDSEIEVSLSVQKGVISLATNVNLTFTEGDGGDDRFMTFTGKVADVNAALFSMCYIGDSEYSGPDTLNITVNDLGNNGKGDPGIISGTVPITVVEQNDTPVITMPEEPQQATEDIIAVLQPISVFDAEDRELTVVLSVDNGRITLADTTGLQFLSGDGIDDETMTFTGKMADINVALAALVYLNNLDYNGLDMLHIGITDLDQYIEDALNIEIAPVNDAPFFLLT